MPVSCCEIKYLQVYVCVPSGYFGEYVSQKIFGSLDQAFKWYLCYASSIYATQNGLIVLPNIFFELVSRRM